MHALAQDPEDPNKIWRREHTGMFRSKDGGESWEKIENGLPSWFGFPIAIDAKTRNLFAIPAESDEYRMMPEGKCRVYRSANGGDSWESTSSGLPQEHDYSLVLRQALAVDGKDPHGIYFGTTMGSVYVSPDAGASWQALPVSLPRVLCVEAFEE